MADELNLTEDPGDFSDAFDPAKLAPKGPNQPDLVDDNADGFSEPFNPTTTLRDQATAYEQGLNAGLAHGVPAAVGAAAGARVGAKAGAAIGTAVEPGAGTAVGAALGGLTGAAFGMVAGDYAGNGVQNYMARVQMPDGNYLTYESFNAVPPELRPFAKAGEMTGSSIPLAGLPLYAAATGRSLSVPALTSNFDDISWWNAPYVVTREGSKKAINLLPRFVNTIINSAQKQPLAFMMAETQAATMAGAGAGIAEASYPGSGKAEFIGSTVGGFFSPTRWISWGLRTTAGGVATLLKGRKGVEENVARYVQNIVRNSGMSFEDTVNALGAKGGPLEGVDLTAALKSGNPALLALEQKLAHENQKFGVDAAAAGEAATAKLKGLILAFRRPDASPEELKIAAYAEQNLYAAETNALMQSTANKLTELSANINPNVIDAKSFTDFGKQANAILDDALATVRKTEADLWNAVPQFTKAENTNFTQAVIDTRANRLLPTQKLDLDIENYLKIVNKRQQVTEQIETLMKQKKKVSAELLQQQSAAGVANFKELRILRSELLNMVRKYAAADDWNSANLYGYLATAVDKDLANAVAPDAAGELALTSAREFSKQMHDAFTRTFVGDIQGAARDGAQAIPPELVMKRVFGGGQEVGALQFQQLREASRFAGQEYFGRMQALQFDTLRYAASKVVDPATGNVNANALAKFRRDNADLLGQFPALNDELSDIARAKSLFDRTRSAKDKAVEDIIGSSAFSQVIKVGDPAEAVGQALQSADPVTMMRQFKLMAQGRGAAAEAGLESSFWHWAIKTAGGAEQSFSFDRMNKFIFQPVSASGPTVADIMVKSGIIERGQINQLKAVLGEASRIETALANKQSIEQFQQKSGPIVDFVLRLVGSKFGAWASGGSNSLIVQGAGSSALRQVFDSVPRGKANKLLLEAMRNPEMLAMLLQKPVSPKAKFQLGLQMNAFMYANILGGWNDENGQFSGN